MSRRNLVIAGAVAAVILIWIVFPKGKHVKTVSSETASPVRRNVSAQALYQQALSLERSGDALEAKKLYKEIFTDHSDFEKIEEVQKELENLNMTILFSNILTPDSVMHEVAGGDTLGKLAKKYGTTVELIKISNNLKSDTIRVGQRLRIWTASFNVFVDKSQNVLMLKKGGEVLKVYRVSTGANNSTPIGNFKITSKLIDPVWFNRGVVVPPDSPQNVLGSRWLGFDFPTGYGIHGTVEPDTIGQQVTAGCVRMRNSEVEQLYNILPLGTEVVIVD